MKGFCSNSTSNIRGDGGLIMEVDIALMAYNHMFGTLNRKISCWWGVAAGVVTALSMWVAFLIVLSQEGITCRILQ